MRLTREQMGLPPYKRGGTANMIISSVHDEQGNVKLWASNPAILRALNEHIDEKNAEAEYWRQAFLASQDAGKKLADMQIRKRKEAEAARVAAIRKCHQIVAGDDVLVDLRHWAKTHKQFGAEVCRELGKSIRAEFPECFPDGDPSEGDPA